MGNFKRTILLWWNVCRYVLRWMVIYMDQLLSHTSPDVKCMHPAYHEDVSAFLESFIVLQIVSVSYLYGIVWHLLGSKRPSTGNNQYVFIYMYIHHEIYINITVETTPLRTYRRNTHDGRSMVEATTIKHPSQQSHVFDVTEK